MKRPLAVIGFGYLAGAGLSFLAVQFWNSCLGAVFLAFVGLATFGGACLWMVAKKKKGGFVVAAFSLSLCLSACAVLLSTMIRDQPMARLSGQEATVTGKITALETAEIRSTLELTAEETAASSFAPLKVPVHLKLYCYE